MNHKTCPLILLSLLLSISAMAQKQIPSGRIAYETEILWIPEKGRTGETMFSNYLTGLFVRHNIPKYQSVYFDSQRSRVEQVDNDYGFMSPSILFKKAGKEQLIYCKDFPFFNFQVEFKNQIRPTEDETFIPRLIPQK